MEGQQPGRAGHRGSDRDHAFVGLGLLDDRLGERLRVAGRHRLRWSDQRVEHGSVVQVLLVVVLRRGVPAPLLGEHVDEDRSIERQLDRVEEGVLHLLDVVSVERADVPDAERLEERRWLQELADARLERLHRRAGLMADDGQVLEEVLEPTLPADVDRVQADVGERV
jgi:hypothetical protein